MRDVSTHPRLQDVVLLGGDKPMAVVVSGLTGFGSEVTEVYARLLRSPDVRVSFWIVDWTKLVQSGSVLVLAEQIPDSGN